MPDYIVTVKLPNNPAHDPKNKITGTCPIGKYCTDVTGAHHSFLVEGYPSAESAKRLYEGLGHHVTRVELARP